MKKSTSIGIGLGVILFCLLYFGLNTKPKEQRAVEKSRAVNLEATGIQNILTEARDSLSQGKLALFEAINEDVRNAENDEIKKESLRQLSSAWFEEGFPIISGYYAEEIAKINNDHDSWSVAGTTYILGMRDAKDKSDRLYARSKALQATEAAISLEPENVADQINLALIYVEAPDTNPMQGILMLKKLNDKYPDNVKVLNQLGRLAIQTNQTAKALERLSHAFEIDSANRNTICLLATAHEQAGNDIEAKRFKTLCSN